MKHETRIAPETITIKSETGFERVEVFRVHCSCGFLGTPYIRKHVAVHEQMKHEHDNRESPDATTATE